MKDIVESLKLIKTNVRGLNMLVTDRLNDTSYETNGYLVLENAKELLDCATSDIGEAIKKLSSL